MRYIHIRPDTPIELQDLPTSARQPITRAQQVALVLLFLALLLGVPPITLLVGLTASVTILYFLQMGFNTYLSANANGDGGMLHVEEEVALLERHTLPKYAVMVPLYKETSVVDDLIKNLAALDYPTDRLQIVLLLEEDDTPMVEYVEACDLPAHFRIMLIPPSQPRTKPKAMNIGLQYLDAEYIAVYDAEDRPDPDQLLKAVAAFRMLPKNVACVQGLLTHHNPKDNMLTRFFASEYASWFRLYLPGLARHGWLFILGGTSNHFKASALREVGAWDPFNVTEDADLGVRLARAGYLIKTINTYTWEEANGHAWSWIKQRSRWIKGYMQTYLTHMRDPIRLLRELGFQRFFVFQMMFGVAALTNLLNPFFWVLTAVYFLTRSTFIEALFPGPILYLGALSMLAGNFLAIYISLTGAFLQREYGSIKWMLFTPVYWLMMSIAAWRALNQLIFNPHYWDKTMHGSDKGKAATAPAAGVGD
jgi:cellulose synthase/poly-beta-1,6-N-acetylglucosamine synthase-like glycosyltransferase